MENLNSLTNKLENKIENWSFLNPEISKSSVGWHIEHTLLTIDRIIKAVGESNPEEYKSKFSFAKLYVFTFNKIPRGRIQSPPSVRPVEGFTNTSLKNHFETSYVAIKKLDSFNEKNYLEYPLFGHLNLKSATQFLKIHTAHHLSIINDILKPLKK